MVWEGREENEHQSQLFNLEATAEQALAAKEGYGESGSLRASVLAAAQPGSPQGRCSARGQQTHHSRTDYSWRVDFQQIEGWWS